VNNANTLENKNMERNPDQQPIYVITNLFKKLNLKKFINKFCKFTIKL
jgi:hypothetical protein